MHEGWSDNPDEHEAARAPRRSCGPAARALSEVLRRPPLRVRSHHEPADRVDGYPTFELAPCSAGTAVAILDRVTRGRGTLLVVDGAVLLDPHTSPLTHAEREALAPTRIGDSLLVNTTVAIGVARATRTRLTFASIDGPVDASDVRAIEDTLTAGATPLDADLRAIAVVQAGGESARWSPVWCQFRDEDEAKRFMARALLLLVARVCGSPPALLPSIDLASLRLPIGGFTVRPREIRIDDVTIAVTVRAASGRRIRTLTLDRTTERWYV